MASGNRGFSVHEVLDILDDSADGECTIDDEPFVDNTQLQKRGEPNYDRLGKIRPIMLI